MKPEAIQNLTDLFNRHRDLPSVPVMLTQGEFHEIEDAVKQLTKEREALLEALRELTGVFPQVARMAPYGVPLTISAIHDKACATLHLAES